MTRVFRVAVVGLGKIAQDQHLPAIAASPRFDLAAVVDPHRSIPGVPMFASLEALLAADVALDAVAICTPPQVRATLAGQALDAGLAVLLEKPPAATLDQFAALEQQARAAGLTLFSAWHSRFAPMVEPARQWLAGRTVTGGKVDWREDVRRWHPGQHWLWQAGGMGVFDPGINAFSILTAILATPLAVSWAELDVPENRQTPIAVRAWLSMGSAAIGVTLDFLETRAQAWDILLETACGHRLQLSDGGATLRIDAAAPRHGQSAEYAGVYARFAQLLDHGGSETDAAPMALALEALALGGVRRVAAFLE